MANTPKKKIVITLETNTTDLNRALALAVLVSEAASEIKHMREDAVQSDKVDVIGVQVK